VPEEKAEPFMHRNCRRWAGLFALIALTVLAGLSARLAASTKESKDGSGIEKPKIVAPPNQAVLLSGRFDVIYRGTDAPLEVDSRPVAWEDDYDAPVRVGNVRLSPGMHQVQIGEQKIELCIALNEMEHDGPSDWKIFRAHQMSNERDRCAECHETETREGRMVVEQVLAPDSCMACHTAGEVKEPHQDFIQPLESCQTCHLLHGSPYPSLLKAPKAQIRKKFAAAG
jgi:hypothetical protein